MADENDKHVCKNPPCTCPVDKKGDYCSISCQNMGDATAIDCDCGHEACGGDF
jgi:hypothetical protein